MRTAISCALLSFVFLLAIGPVLNVLEPKRCPMASPASHDAAQAIPAFARKLNVACTTCHLAVPYLNSTGRKFMERGYRMPDETGEIDEEMQNHQTINQNLVLEKMLPLALRIVSVPVTATTGQPVQSQPLSDFDLLAMGNFYKYGSFHFALGAGADEGFAPAADGRLGIHPAEYLNVIAGFGGAFSSDPYNTFRTGDIGLTRQEKQVLVDGHDSLTALDDDRQFLEAYGRVGIVYYAAGLVGATDLTTGELPETGMLRVAIDPVDDLSFGAFALGGRREGGDAAGGPVKASTMWRAGTDVNATFGEVTGVAAFVAAGDQLQNEVEHVNLGGFVEGIYAIRLDGRPILLPVARLDWSQDNGDNILGGAFDLSTYVIENVRVGGEASYQSSLSPGATGTAVGTIFVDAAF